MEKALRAVSVFATPGSGNVQRLHKCQVGVQMGAVQHRLAVEGEFGFRVSGFRDNGAGLLRKVRETSERYPGEALLFLFEAGTPAKLVISEMARTTYKDIYIDMGTVLDGYAGLRSRDYNDPQMYCRKTRARNESVDDWFRPRVCG